MAEDFPMTNTPLLSCHRCTEVLDEPYYRAMRVGAIYHPNCLAEMMRECADAVEDSRYQNITWRLILVN